MITKITDGKVTVEAHGKLTGVYTLNDFDDDELREEKAILISQLFTKKIDEVGYIYDMVAIINGELDIRKLREMGCFKYFNLAKELAEMSALNINQGGREYKID